MSDQSETKPPADEGRLDRRVRPHALLLAHKDGRETLHPIREYAVAYRDTAVRETLLYALTDEEVRILNKAKSDALWRARRLDLCKCDHIEFCRHCYPPEFREGGEWHGA